MCKKTRLKCEIIAKETFSRLLREEFDKNYNWWQVESAKEIIITARFYSFHTLANQMADDLNY